MIFLFIIALAMLNVTSAVEVWPICVTSVASLFAMGLSCNVAVSTLDSYAGGRSLIPVSACPREAC